MRMPTPSTRTVTTSRLEAFDVVTDTVGDPSGDIGDDGNPEILYEDVPRDCEYHVDSAGNTYDFAFGINWSGVIDDDRVATYKKEPLTEPEF